MGDYTPTDDELNRRAALPRWDLVCCETNGEDELDHCCETFCIKYTPGSKYLERGYACSPVSCGRYTDNVTTGAPVYSGDDPLGKYKVRWHWNECSPCACFIRRKHNYFYSPYWVYDKRDLQAIPLCCMACNQDGTRCFTPVCACDELSGWNCMCCFPWKSKKREQFLPCCCYHRRVIETENHTIEKTTWMGCEVNETVTKRQEME